MRHSQYYANKLNNIAIPQGNKNEKNMGSKLSSVPRTLYVLITIQYSTIQCNIIQFNMKQYDTTQVVSI